MSPLSVFTMSLEPFFPKLPYTPWRACTQELALSPVTRGTMQHVIIFIVRKTWPGIDRRTRGVAQDPITIAHFFRRVWCHFMYLILFILGVSYFYYFYLCVCMSIQGLLCVCWHSEEPEKEVPELELQVVVCCPSWMLGAELLCKRTMLSYSLKEPTFKPQ